MNIYVSVHGDDENTGTIKQPFQSIERARKQVQKVMGDGPREIKVQILEGTYYLNEPLVFGSDDGNIEGGSIQYEGIGKVTISGGIQLKLQWKPYKDGIFQSKVEKGIWFDQLFANGERQIMARYPNYDGHARYYNGYAADSFSKSRTAHYKNPAGGYMYAMHEGLWGDFQYEVTGVDENGALQYQGGHQNNRNSHMHNSIRYIENIFEELDTPKEWFLDTKESILYYKPPSGLDMTACIWEGAVLKNLVSFQGDIDRPVCHISLKNLTFTHTARTFMEPMEPLLRSDWMVYRGGTIFIKGTKGVSIEDCCLDQVGGNGVFVSGFNSLTSISGCVIKEAGASSIVFAGESDAVRAPLFSYESTYEDGIIPDLIPGPRTGNYPVDGLVVDNLLIRSGRFEKQTAGVCISMAERIKVRHNTIYEVPRAGINICDGNFGGHVIEHNLVFDTVLETSDHGAFNSWGRDRYWDSRYNSMKEVVEKNPEFPFLDAVSKTILRNNCFACEHGWDIDLDDGSSNYEICYNLCLNGGIKNREGFLRVVYNNILLNNTYHPHVWFPDSKDRFFRNIIFSSYADIGINEWGEEFDYNILYDEYQKGEAIVLQEKSHMDVHSIYDKVEFTDAIKGDFIVKLTEEMKAVGFENIKIHEFGVVSEKLRKLAKSPFGIDYVIRKAVKRDEEPHGFEGMVLKNLTGLGEISATGMYQECGIYIRSMEPEGDWYKLGLRANDVILSADGKEINQVEELIEMMEGGVKELVIWRHQGKHMLSK